MFRNLVPATVAVATGLVCTSLAGAPAAAADASRLRLVPFPKEVQLEEGTFSLARPLILAVAPGATRVGEEIRAELERAGLPAPRRETTGADHVFWLGPDPLNSLPEVAFRQGATEEDYVLLIRPGAIAGRAPAPPGLAYAAATLCQLIRANRQGAGLAAMTIRDWPSLRWRCFQDDMTRGPSSKLPTLEREVALGASFKMNLFTYYMEYQYAFRKHPKIGPPDGSLQPDDLEALVRFAQGYHVQILGNQQSFGHFGRILRHEEYADLRENASVLSPVREGTYRLLDDLYSEVCPRLPFPMFNVCCDETWGLGQGPSRERAAEIGVGGVYVEHIRRVHDLLKAKYHKRMMMWGDIILQHPDKLDQVPKDTVMLTWGYGARASFEDQIIPFAESGYQFFVCPGISNWSRILPDFGVATTNIHHFVRDGARHGAWGMLNTAWEDDGEALQGYKWHGYAWGAECAWNASATTPDAFNRRLGAVLFGEPGDHFGRAIELLGKTHRLPGMQGMNNRRFWQDDFLPKRPAAAIRQEAERLLGVVRPAIDHLEACRRGAVVNADLLDYFLLGARRMELIGQRMLDGLQVARLYAQAVEAPADKAVSCLEQAEALIHKNAQAHQALRDRFRALWLAESKPYALDWTLRRYAAAGARYETLAQKIAQARDRVRAGQPLPPPEKLRIAPPAPEKTDG